MEYTEHTRDIYDQMENAAAADEAAGGPPERDPLGALLDRGGKYRWIYEVPMLKSFFLLMEVWKVLGISAFLVFIVMSFIDLLSGQGFAGILFSLEMCLLLICIFLVLSLPAYYIVTKANNGKYTVLFEMDDSGIDHTQIKTDKARALEMLTAYVGSAVKNRTTTAAAVLSAAGTSLYSRYDKVRSIKALPEKNTILLNGRFVRNQIYAEDRYFDAVYDYIRRHCPNAEIR
ncbi:MAG: hypothetical protein IKE18_04555 [Oscillospiraceae bacterium]|nr:hypothetical protein [Oscillospiraceae bacterium]